MEKEECVELVEMLASEIKRLREKERRLKHNLICIAKACEVDVDLFKLEVKK